MNPLSSTHIIQTGIQRRQSNAPGFAGAVLTTDAALTPKKIIAQKPSPLIQIFGLLTRNPLQQSGTLMVDTGVATFRVPEARTQVKALEAAIVKRQEEESEKGFSWLESSRSSELKKAIKNIALFVLERSGKVPNRAFIQALQNLQGFPVSYFERSGKTFEINFDNYKKSTAPVIKKDETETLLS